MRTPLLFVLLVIFFKNNNLVDLLFLNTTALDDHCTLLLKNLGTGSSKYVTYYHNYVGTIQNASLILRYHVIIKKTLLCAINK